MAKWTKYFIISGCTKFVLPGIGELNANNENMAISKLEKAYERKCPYVSLTKEGIEKYEPTKEPIQIKKIQSEDAEGEKPKKKKYFDND